MFASTDDHEEVYPSPKRFIFFRTHHLISIHNITPRTNL